MANKPRTNWPFRLMVPVVVVVFFVDAGVFAPCKCWHGVVEKYQALAAISVLGWIVARFVAAWLFREHNHGWRYYIGAAALSPILVTLIFRLMIAPEVLRHP